MENLALILLLFGIAFAFADTDFTADSEDNGAVSTNRPGAATRGWRHFNSTRRAGNARMRCHNATSNGGASAFNRGSGMNSLGEGRPGFPGFGSQNAARLNEISGLQVGSRRFGSNGRSEGNGRGQESLTFGPRNNGGYENSDRAIGGNRAELNGGRYGSQGLWN